MLEVRRKERLTKGPEGNQEGQDTAVYQGPSRREHLELTCGGRAWSSRSGVWRA